MNDPQDLLVPEEIRRLATDVENSLLPVASRERYEHAFVLFEKWKSKRCQNAEQHSHPCNSTDLQSYFAINYAAIHA